MKLPKLQPDKSAGNKEPLQLSPAKVEVAAVFLFMGYYGSKAIMVSFGSFSFSQSRR